jgi:hypothetical protein
VPPDLARNLGGLGAGRTYSVVPELPGSVFDEVVRHFERRHPGQKIGTRNKASVRCASHEDKTSSCTLFLMVRAGFRCNGC